MYSNESGVNSNICQTCGNVNLMYNEASSKKSGIFLSVLGWIFAAISFLFFPIVFGASAFLLGFFTYSGRSKVHGAMLMAFAVIGFVFGSMLSFFVAGTMFI